MANNLGPPPKYSSLCGPPPTYLQVQLSKMKIKPDEQLNRVLNGRYYRPKAKTPKSQNTTATLSVTQSKSTTTALLSYNCKIPRCKISSK